MKRDRRDNGVVSWKILFKKVSGPDNLEKNPIYADSLHHRYHSASIEIRTPDSLVKS